ncbi:MAG TPA: glucuronate isomerase, partial [Candidatus Parabacteroides intestinavium]|nr:glucuronate isomerase [Candidatus Parabacteroides intestinavium]
LYHESAEHLPIIDYHCHLDPKQIAENYPFRNLAEIWLGGDHYKWRAMRGNGVPEEFITGGRSDYEKFEKWAETVPYTMRNPLYHWTHLELSRIFGIDKIVKPETAREIYEECTAKLQTEEFRAARILERCHVEVVCTTDDPADSLIYHRQIPQLGIKTKVYPAWRPDKVLAIENPESYLIYIQRLAESADQEIRTYDDLLEVLRKRHDYFASLGCRLSDHGMDNFYADAYTETEIRQIFAKVLAGKQPDETEIRKFKSALLFELAIMDWEKDWVQQYHISVIRNNCTRMYQAIGPDTGFDAILEVNCSAVGHKFLNRLDAIGKLTKTILYSLNPKDNEVLATLAYTFNEAPVPGKIQLGAAWWFLDQEEGMKKQLNTLSAMGLLSRFVGMLTDSRSFLSYPRHEYFRRILCNLIGEDVETGKLPYSEMDFLKQMIEDICYRNAKRYFGF